MRLAGAGFTREQESPAGSSLAHQLYGLIAALECRPIDGLDVDQSRIPCRIDAIGHERVGDRLCARESVRIHHNYSRRIPMASKKPPFPLGMSAFFSVSESLPGQA